ncbi:hypothetical protein TNCV_3866561, partial [Trichonephila clavipes]
ICEEIIIKINYIIIQNGFGGSLPQINLGVQGVTQRVIRIACQFDDDYIHLDFLKEIFILKTSTENRLESVEPEFRLQISNTTPDITTLVEEMQHHPSH